MKKKLLPLLLALLLLLQGCSIPDLSDLFQAKPDPVNTQTQPEELPERWYDYGTRDYHGHVAIDVCDYSQMEYKRPDVDAMCKDFDALAEQAADTRDTQALLEGYYRLYDALTDFYTMQALADLRYCLNQNDEYYSAEYEYCCSAEPDVQQSLEALYKAFAAGRCRRALELEYFGDGFFDWYDDYEYYTNETVLALSRQEAELLVRYRSALEAPTVTVDGEECPYNELLQSGDWDMYYRVQQAYYEKYNPILGEIYVELVRVRKQIAAALGYERYDEYAYAADYSRTYTPQEADEFLAGIRSELAPVSEALAAQGEPMLSMVYIDPSEKNVRAIVSSAAKEMGGTIWEAYRFMDAYGLSDLTRAEEKTDISFVTYLYNWEAPFLTVDATGYEDDITSFAHEFGHFTDAYYNYNADEDLETSETYSQAMEYLALCRSDKLSDRQRDYLLRLKLEDTLNTFIEQAAYADFESRVYALPENELTVERINELYRELTGDYGFCDPDIEDPYYALGWIDVLHFFEMPFYVISYCISADTSLQVYEREVQKSGSGLDAYQRLLDRYYGVGVQQVMEDAGLEDPFAAGRLSKDADFLRKQLGLGK